MQSNPRSPYYHQWLQFYKSRPLMVIWILRGRQIDKIDLALSQWRNRSRLHWTGLSGQLLLLFTFEVSVERSSKAKWLLTWPSVKKLWELVLIISQQKCLIREAFNRKKVFQFSYQCSKSTKMENIHRLMLMLYQPPWNLLLIYNTITCFSLYHY